MVMICLLEADLRSPWEASAPGGYKGASVFARKGLQRGVLSVRGSCFSPLSLTAGCRNRPFSARQNLFPLIRPWAKADGKRPL